MGLTTDQMSDMVALGRLAANPKDATHEEIYLAITALYRVQGAHLTPRERALVQDIIRTLSPNVSIRIRAALAERLSEDESAPRELILHLAADVIEVARPILARNPLLTDDDLLRLAAETDVAHCEAIGSRAYLSERVCEALAKRGPQSIVATLAANATARLSASVLDLLLDKAPAEPSVREQLSRRKDVLRGMATNIPSPDAVPSRSSSEVAPRFPVSQAAHEPIQSDNKLIEKLAVSGQLRASFLMRVLNQGQIDLFDAGLARLLGLPVTGLRELFYESGPRAAALACRAAGIDRCVFQTIFTLSRKAHGNVAQTLHSGDLADVDAAFRTSKPAALGLLQAA